MVTYESRIEYFFKKKTKQKTKTKEIDEVISNIRIYK